MDAKSFIIVDKGRCFRFSRAARMYVVEGVDIRGVATQGRTFETALANAHDAADLMEEFHAEMDAGKGAAMPRRTRSRSRRAPALTGK